MSTSRPLALAAASVLLWGCASPGAPVTRDARTISVVTASGTVQVDRGVDIRTNQRVEVTPLAAWNALPAVYRDLGIDPDMSEPATLRMGVSEYRISRSFLDRPASTFLDCGLDPGLNRPLADQIPVNVHMVTTVLEGPAGTELRTEIQGTGRRSGGNAGVAQCQSTGVLESLIGRMVEDAAGGG